MKSGFWKCRWQKKNWALRKPSLLSQIRFYKISSWIIHFFLMFILNLGIWKLLKFKNKDGFRNNWRKVNHFCKLFRRKKRQKQEPEAQVFCRDVTLSWREGSDITHYELHIGNTRNTFFSVFSDSPFSQHRQGELFLPSRTHV